MTVGYFEINCLVTPIALGVISLFEQINTSTDIWYALIDLVNIFFSIPVNKDN